MGYPMTFRRFVDRNRLLASGGHKAPGYSVPSAAAGPMTTEEGQLRAAIAGDLIRLIEDSLDEQAICRYIASRTGIEQETVAVVLQEFFAW